MPLRDVPGHRRIVELLSRSVRHDTLPPSLIFAGPPGAGKRLTATAVAQALNCLKSADGDACGTCASCTRIARGVHPDVLAVEPGDNGSIKIDQVRDVVDRAAYRPFEGRRRVVIIDEADQLVPAAQNALLKTLEEPTPSSVFILLTSRPHMLLDTVRSRCIRLTFAAGARLEPGDADARGIAERVLSDAVGRGSRDAQRLDAARALLPKTGAGAASDRETLSAHLKSMASLIRDMAVISSGAQGVALANADARPALERLAPSFQGARAPRAFASIDQALAAIDANAGVKVVADWLVLQL